MKRVIDDDVKQIVVDFDGVIHEYHEWTGPEPKNDPIPGAESVLRELKEDGYEVVVFSTRPADPIRAWLATHDLDQYVAEVIDGKPFYDAMFCDRAWNVEKNADDGLRTALDKATGD